MYIFEKNKSKAYLTDNKVRVEYAMEIEEFETSLYIDLKEFKIHFYVATEAEIEDGLESSIKSFFRFWYLKKGEEALVDHMRALGFTMRQVVDYTLSDPASRPVLQQINESKAKYQTLQDGHSRSKHHERLGEVEYALVP